MRHIDNVRFDELYLIPRFLTEVIYSECKGGGVLAPGSICPQFLKFILNTSLKCQKNDEKICT
jgi:hypothetical protein